MSGDGVSMPTQLAQLGNVAKTQARVQQAAQPATNFSDQLEKNDELKAQRIKEAKEAEKGRINADEDRRQKRKKRRRQKKILESSDGKENLDGEAPREEVENPEEEIGVLVDLRA
jgi:hypothetical protein